MSDTALAAAIRFMFQDEPWMDYARCKSMVTSGSKPNPFFPSRGESKDEALKICAKCSVTGPCGEYADRSGSVDGVWGGVLRTRDYEIGVTAPSVVHQEDPIVQPEPVPVEIRRMLPKSLSATSALAFEECPARYKVEYLERTPSGTSDAAGMGSACHEAMEGWVRDKHYLTATGTPGAKGIIQGYYDVAYWGIFSDARKYKEGLDLVLKWLDRQDWTDREVISTEQKLNFNLKTSVGDIPFNYIMDRLDRRPSTGDIEVIDYKSLIIPMPPEALKKKLQARMYGLAAQLAYPDANRIWVFFDMLRYDPIGIVFDKEENRETWRYIHRLAERIINTPEDEAPEILGEGCRWCLRKSVCVQFNKHADAGGPLGITDSIKAAQRYHELESARVGIDNHLKELAAVIMSHMEHEGVTSLDLGDYEAAASISARRGIDAKMLARVVTPEIFADYGNMNITSVDEMMKDARIDAQTKAAIKDLITRNYGDAKVKVTKKAPF